MIQQGHLTIGNSFRIKKPTDKSKLANNKKYQTLDTKNHVEKHMNKK